MFVDNIRRRKRQMQQAKHGQVLIYDSIPKDLPGQMHQVLDDALGTYHRTSYMDPWEPVDSANRLWEVTERACAREIGHVDLGGHLMYGPANPRDRLLSYLTSTQDVDEFLVIIEIALKLAAQFYENVHPHQRRQLGCRLPPDDAVAEVNQRFTDVGFGYRFVSGQMICLSEEFIQREVTEPALACLIRVGLSHAEKDFRQAHAHYRAGAYEDANTAALRSFESTMKGICDANGWTYDPKATASVLVDCIIHNALVPAYANEEMTALRQLLKGGLPTVRNKAGGHGRGQNDKEATRHLAAFALHMCAATIVFLVECQENLRRQKTP